jgi:cell wall-associated NlpC family hydrolase
VGASAAALASMTLLPTASQADPSIGDVEQRLDSLYHQAEAAQERLNTLNHQMEAKRERLHALQTDLRSQRRHYSRFSDQIATMAAEEAQSVESQLSATQQLILADNPDEFLDNLAAQEALSTQKGDMLAHFSTVAKKLALREKQVQKQFAAVASDQKQAAKEENTVDARVADAEDLLSHLKAERRERLASEPSRSAVRTTSAPVSGAAGVAVDFALDQVGDAYVYGAAGPDAWDCSGLTMGAWGAAGVSLPHSSSAQMSSGTPVSYEELQPGDLVFYYQPVSHVALYIGNGQIVHASNPSDPVNVASVDSMPYSGAVRPG